MYPVLILRSELTCLVILVFLYFTSRAYNVDRESRSFSRILCFALIHVLFDIVTVITVNHTDTVPMWLNWSCHIIFYLSAILFSNEIASYVLAICYPRQSKKLYAAGHLLTLIYLCCLSFLKVEYVADVGTYSSAGSAAVTGYGLAFLFFIAALVVIFTHMRMMPASIKSALIPMMLVLIIMEASQMIWKSILFTGGAITIVTVGFFFSLENPVAVFKKKAMTDALTGVRSRSSYEEDIEKFDRRFAEEPGDEYIFVFCDLNDLRSVNNRLGHAEGDNYITLIASSVGLCMKHSSAVYRIGGDEFLVLYYKTDEDTVNRELADLRAACAEASVGLGYTASVSVGYAQSSSTYKSLRDVVKSADFAMYQNKAQNKGGSSYAADSHRTNLNYTGLTDKIFDAMCVSNDKIYPFITNLDTNVTRIAPGWKDYFGLDQEFYSDFTSVWKDRIHPDFYDGYMEDVIAVINGHRKYHHFDYLAKKADGEYVRVSCQGSIYRNVSDGTAYFTGFLTNYGMEEDTDPLTGLRSFESLSTRIGSYMDEGRPFSVLKLKLNNFARVNMLYGYSGGKEVIQRIARILSRELGNRGEVFFQSFSNFTILFDTSDEQTVEDYYRNISEICAVGAETDVGTVPILLSGGAYTNNGEKRELDQIRGSLVFAVEESHYTQRQSLVFYRDRNMGPPQSDIIFLSKLYADALLVNNHFHLFYQPIVDIASRKTVGAEALLRWIHPDYGVVLPGRFIAFLENDPCYYRLGLAILEQAVKDAKKIQEKFPRFRVNVNITALQLQNDSFGDHLFEILEKYNYAPGGLMLELTERCKEMDSSFLARRIAELRNRGVLVAFDDLGTGHSTISLLMDIPVDEIKLDKDFVRDIRARENYQLFVRALVLGSAAPGNNYNICFEGIEDEDTLSLVGLFGDFLAQGYYFAKPLMIDDFNNYISSELQSSAADTVQSR